MIYFNDGVKAKAYMLEFYINDALQDAISFSLPPQNEEFRNTQRVNETKTFGGIVFDDYGNDAGKISISGTTANNDLRLVFSGRNINIEMNGEEEIFYINDMIQKYGRKSNLQNKKVILYNLNAENTSARYYWQVLINSFLIKRSSTKPFAFDYQLECTTIPDDKNLSKYKNRPNRRSVNQYYSEINTKIKKQKTILSVLQKGLYKYQEFQNVYTSAYAKLDQLETTVQAYADVVSGYIDQTSSYIRETQKLGDYVINETFRITAGNVINVYQSVADLIGTTADFVDYVRHVDDTFVELNAIYKTEFGETTDNIINNIHTLANEFQKNTDDIAAQTSKQGGYVFSGVIPGNDETDDKSIVVFGDVKVTVKQNMSWSYYAYIFYNNPDLGSLIASYNNDKELEPGEEIQIPIITPTDQQDLEIYNKNGKSDSYGKDILIDTDGDIVTRNGDFDVISGPQNLNQQITSRLRTTLNSRIRLVTYGIRSRIGSASLSQSYIIASIRQTLEQEVRIKSIDSIKFTGHGDRINVSVVYTDINNEKSTYGGQF